MIQKPYQKMLFGVAALSLIGLNSDASMLPNQDLIVMLQRCVAKHCLEERVKFVNSEVEKLKTELDSQSLRSELDELLKDVNAIAARVEKDENANVHSILKAGDNIRDMVYNEGKEKYELGIELYGEEFKTGVQDILSGSNQQSLNSESSKASD